MSLFRTIDEIKEFVEVSLQLNFEDLEPSIKIAEKKYLLPLLGKETYDLLVAAFDANPNLENVSADDNAKLLLNVRPVIANYSIAIAIPRLSVEVSSAGIHITSTDTKKTAFAWQVKQAQDSYFAAGDMFSDELLTFLEVNKATYTDWAASSAFTEYIDNLVYSTKTVDDIVKIASSRLLFLRMKPKLKMAQDFQLIDTIGSDYLDELMASLRAGVISDDDYKVIQMAQKGIIHIAASDVLREGIFSFDQDGVTLITNRNTDVIVGKDSAPAAVIERTADKWNDLGLAWMERLRVFLNANASSTVYATYFGSDLYEVPSTTTGGLTNDAAWSVGMF